MGSLEEVEAELRSLERSGVTRVYLQHPDLEDFRSIKLLGELAGRLAT